VFFYLIGLFFSYSLACFHPDLIYTHKLVGKKTQIEVSFENIMDLAIEKFRDKLYKWEKPFNNYKQVWVKANERSDETLALNSQKKMRPTFFNKNLNWSLWTNLESQTFQVPNSWKVKFNSMDIPLLNNQHHLQQSHFYYVSTIFNKIISTMPNPKSSYDLYFSHVFKVEMTICIDLPASK